LEDKRNRAKEESELGDGISGKKMIDPVMLKKKAKKNDNSKNSNYVKFYRAQNDCHEIDDEKAGSIIGNLSRDPIMLKTNPYYNRRLLKTTHATHLDSESLYKMG
jgi:hypothetical protein